MAFWQPSKLIETADPVQADHILQSVKRALGKQAHLLDDPKVYDLLLGIAGGSPYLSQLMVRRAETLAKVICDGPDKTGKDVLKNLARKGYHPTSLSEVMTLLRNAKADIALITAIADIGGTWSLKKVTRTLSNLADLAVQIAVAFALYERMVRGKLPWPDDKEDQLPVPHLGKKTGYFILALGKLGGKELNYSSDIDLVAFYDPARVPDHFSDTLRNTMVKVTQTVVKILNDRTQEGYVFRTDLRLRPDPGSTPLAVSVSAAETYYQSIGQTWERAAFIKARFIAGDKDAAEAFLDVMRPFVWRRNLDFSAIEDIHAMKVRTHSHHQHGEAELPGHDVKLGRGGIREIEFIAQCEQLISGGRDWSLRKRKTLKALKALGKAGRLPKEAVKELKKSYIFLRTLEHRLQMIRDEQTHIIPDDLQKLDRLALFSGYACREELNDAFEYHTSLVQKHYAAELPDRGKSGDKIPTGDALSDYLSLRTFKEPNNGREIIERWRSGRYRALRSERSRRLLENFIAGLIDSLSATSNPDEALARFDRFIERLPAGVQLFSLLQANRWLFDLLAKVMGSAPLLAEHLARRPNLIEAVLDPGFFGELPDRKGYQSTLEEAVRRSHNYEETLNTLRRIVNDARFQIGVHLLEGLTDADTAGKTIANLADATLNVLLPLVEEGFAEKYGHIKEGELALVAMGSYGGESLSYTSDLDLIMLYKAEGNASDGRKNLSPSQYYSRLGTQLITALSALMEEGRLFEIDVRLRPSGNQGPLVVTLDTFRDYQLSSAWTWEHMALTRARIIRADKGFRENIIAAIDDALSQKRDVAVLLQHVADMREKLFREFGSDRSFDVREARGGLVDIEFIVQTLLLEYGHTHKSLFTPSLLKAIRNLDAANLFPKNKAEDFIQAYRLQLALQGLLRLCYAGGPAATDLSDELKTLLAATLGCDGFDVVERQLAEAQGTVKDIYETVITKRLATVKPEDKTE